MNAVRHFPLAEQYPSRIASTSGFASNLTSGMRHSEKIPAPPIRRAGSEVQRPRGGSAGRWLEEELARMASGGLAVGLVFCRD